MSSSQLAHSYANAGPSVGICFKQKKNCSLNCASSVEMKVVGIALVAAVKEYVDTTWKQVV